MKATIKVVNTKRGMYGAKIEESGEFVIFELIDSSEPEIGDIVAHPDFYSMGGETFNNLSQNCEVEVFVQNVCTESQVRQQCFL